MHGSTFTLYFWVTNLAQDITVGTEKVIIQYLLVKLSYQSVYFIIHNSTVDSHYTPHSLSHHGTIL